MKRAIIYSPVQETALLFLNTTLEKFYTDNIKVDIFSNPKLKLGFASSNNMYKTIKCNGNNRDPFSLLSDIYLFNDTNKNDLLIFNGSTTILLSIYFKIIRPFNKNAFILHGTLKSKGKVINTVFISLLFFASLIGVEIYSVNKRFNKFILRKSKFHFLGLAGVGVHKDAISHLRPNYIYRERDDSNLKIAFIGRKEISKGYDLFLDIARLNMDESIDFITIGSEGNVIDLVDSKITHFGALSQQILFQKLKEIDILILPSKSEGLGMVMVECCIAGIPTITSKTYGSLQFIKQNQTGIIVKRNNIKYYTEAINVIKNNYQFYSNNCINYSIEHNSFISKPIHFSW